MTCNTWGHLTLLQRSLHVIRNVNKWIEFYENLGIRPTTYRQNAGTVLPHLVVQIPVFGLCLTK
jgi:hypothetical protein